MTNKILHGFLFAIFVFIGENTFAEQMFIDQNTKVSFDESNYLIFEDVGRITRIDEKSRTIGMTFGKFIRLHIYRDGKEENIDLVDHSYDEKDVRFPIIKPEVKEIKYKDKDNVWIISRGGHRGDRAVLFNLVTGKVSLGYSGNRFSLSPGASKIAFYYSFDRMNNCYVLFVNDVMVYPIVQGGFVWEPLSVPTTKDGVPFNEFTKGYPMNEIETPISWKDNQTIEFSMKENVEETANTQRVKFIVSGLSSRDTNIDTQTIHVRKRSANPIFP